MERRESEREETKAEQPDESIEDLDVADGSDVIGGSTAITVKATGEKQGWGPK